MRVVIGVDPHKGSHAAVAIDANEQQLAKIRVTTAESSDVDGPRLSRAGRLSCFSGEESPLVGDAFQRSRPAVGELDAGTGDEVLDGRGDEYLAGLRERADTRADVHRDTREVIGS